MNIRRQKQRKGNAKWLKKARSYDLEHCPKYKNHMESTGSIASASYDASSITTQSLTPSIRSKSAYDVQSMSTYESTSVSPLSVPISPSNDSIKLNFNINEIAHKNQSQTPSNDDDTKTSENDKMKQLMDEYKAKQQENMKLKQNLLKKMISNAHEDTHFPNIEEFVKEYKAFMNETHNHLVNAFNDILEEILQNENEEDVVSINEAIESVKLEQISYKIVHDIIIECHTAMQRHKNSFYEIISQLLHITHNNYKSYHQMSVFVDSYLQNKWDSFVTNTYYTMHWNHNDRNDDIKECRDSNHETYVNFEHKNIDDIIEGLYDEIKRKLVENTNNTYSVLFMLCKTRKSIDIRVFIAKCCVLFWIMMLYKVPTLRLSHRKFYIKESRDKFNCIDYSINEIQYCGIPGVFAENIQQNKEGLMLIEPFVFVHDNASVVIKALKS